MQYYTLVLPTRVLPQVILRSVPYLTGQPDLPDIDTAVSAAPGGHGRPAGDALPVGITGLCLPQGHQLLGARAREMARGERLFKSPRIGLLVTVYWLSEICHRHFIT